MSESKSEKVRRAIEAWEMADRSANTSVVCDVCDSIIPKSAAKQRVIETMEGPLDIWMCPACIRLGSGDAVRKYVMKEQKDRGR